MDLREEIARIVSPRAWQNHDANGREWAEEWTELVASEIRADTIIQLITTRLTSEEAVEAFHATFERFGQLGALKCQRISDDHARSCIRAAIGRAMDA